ncbi:hypothetical protein ACWZHB_01260 [Nocardia sp. FBN12]|uniref:hypothetical protein n=1 Tax=Nocardia sp. FBN12 TaxID=3419766 RepID=UPI003CFC9A81
MTFVYIQEGGASNEFYVHAFDTEDEADDGRANCARDGAYRTTPIFEFPDIPDEFVGPLFDAVEELLGGLDDLDYAEYDEDDNEDDDSDVADSSNEDGN